MSEGSRPLRVSFRQSRGELEGQCWCGRTYTSPNPREMWDWLDSHEHHPGSAASGPPGTPSPSGALLR